MKIFQIGLFAAVIAIGVMSLITGNGAEKLVSLPFFLMAIISLDGLGEGHE